MQRLRWQESIPAVGPKFEIHSLNSVPDRVALVSGGYRWFLLEFVVGLERCALKVELDVLGELRAKPAHRPLATPARRDVTLHLKTRSSGSVEILLSVAGTPHFARPQPSAIGPRPSGAS